jgi:hypothetical protein
MATKKKKSTKTSKTVGKKVKARKPAKKQKPSRKVAAKKAPASKKALTQKQSLNRTRTAKTASATTKEPKTRQRVSSRQIPESLSGEESGDLQGLSNVETVDSESVDELLEEGNAFEAGIISGVEDAGKREGKEVRTREVPEDDVPGEYLDED